MQTVRCSCGYFAAGGTGEELLATVEAHIGAQHTSDDNRSDVGRAELAVGRIPMPTPEAE